MYRKVFAFILCLAMMLPLCSLSALAAEDADVAAETQSAAGGASGRMGGHGGMMGGASQEGHYAEAVELFEQFEYTDDESGLTIPYNLYLPEGYDDSEEAYPLVIFIADASVNSEDVTAPLNQDGAAVWATAAEQEKHPCIVLVPQYTPTLESELGSLSAPMGQPYTEGGWTDGLTLVKNLIDYVVEEYPVDTNRIYGTGQSQGGMATIAISSKYPDFYAAQFLVACQWDLEVMDVMADDNLWIIVCEGDTQAYPYMNEATAMWAELGATVATDEMWDSTSDAETFAELVAGMLDQDCAINYNVFEGGSHMYTWTVAYTIEGIRDWLFEQSKTVE